jgi:5-oxoprolinase (ATP-hydrolysing)
MKRNHTGQSLFRFSIDRGGTFTDIYAEIPGEIPFVTIKLLSVNPHNYDDPCVEGIRRILSQSAATSELSNKIDENHIDWIRMGTTIATNALLERKGERTALVISKGFKDILQIGNQSRPEIFDLKIKKPDLLYDTTLEINERIRPVKENDNYENTECVTGITGEKFLVLEKPNPDKFYLELERVYKSGIRSLAVVCMHAYSFHDHEKIIGNAAQKIGFSHISLSHQVMAGIKLVSRGDTTVVDAYLTPLIQSYLKSFQNGFSNNLTKSNTFFMQSDGGLVYANKFKGSNAILSGPAGGVVGYAKTTFSEKTEQPVIGFDMGGTSTDVSRYDGTYEIVNETETAGVRIQAPQLYINTVAAGGGSRLFFRNGMFEVGPESAGAHPGPVCYRKNGFLTITDANLFLGRIQPDYFPKIFGKTENLPLDINAAKKAFINLTKLINHEYKKNSQNPLTVEQVASGFIEVANEVMVRPIREISIMRGYDIKKHILACFGGAGGQHACAIAYKLGIKKIFIHRFAGILSAYGLGLADVVIEKQQPCSTVYSTQSIYYLKEKLNILEENAVSELNNQGHDTGNISIKKYLNLRYEGTDTAFMICESDTKGNDYENEFHSTYMREFGFDLKDRKIFVDNIRIRAIAHSPNIKKISIEVKKNDPEPASFAKCYFENGWLKTPIYMHNDLGACQRIFGPAIIIQDGSTILIEPDCRAIISKYGDIEIDTGRRTHQKSSETLDPIQLSIFSSLFMSIAEQMGRTLQKTAISVNIKERLDFSCAMFDQKGNLVANAPHIPVHLGL